VFESSSSEIRPNRPVKEVNIYSFRVLEEKSSLLLRYEARPDVSSIEERFPRAFHELVIERQSD
ncbi:hypothetical protein, partial [Pseudoduganella buxea]|uniref:hypothetical protein n=1 Tax=Pseudoduganella buxea TaxID=1949069 RepID=UPI001B8AA05D